MSEGIEQSKPVDLDPEKCPKCGSDATSAIVQIDDEVEGTVCCSDCGIHYEVVRENGLKYVYWTDEEGERFVYDRAFLVRNRAEEMLAALQQIKENRDYYAEHGKYKYPLGTGRCFDDWAADLAQAVIDKTKGVKL